MNLFKKMRKKIRVYLPYSHNQLDYIQSNVNEMRNDAKALQTLCNALLFCEHLPEHKTGHISKDDADIASQFLLKIALKQNKKLRVIEQQVKNKEK